MKEKGQNLVSCVAFLQTSDLGYYKGLDRAKTELSIFLKIESEYRQVISSKFPRSFRVAGGLVVFYDFFCDFRGFSDLKHHQVTSTPEILRKLA